MRAPMALAIWMDAVPTPEAPACTSAHRPVVSPPWRTNASQAVMYTSGKAPAASSPRASGTAMAWRWCTTTRSA